MKWLAQTPNALTVLRLILAGVFPFVPDVWRLPVVVAAGFSDWLDGFLARRFELRSKVGHLLDAIADKLFAFSALLTLTIDGTFAWWQMPLVISRDLAVAFVAVWIAAKRDWPAFRRMKPRFPGKLATACQFTLLAVVLLWPHTPAATVVLTLTIAVSVVAAADYLGRFFKALSEE